MGALSSIESFIIWRCKMYKLLVVEDEVLIRDIIKEYFATRDYEVIEAVDGYDDSRWGGLENQNDNWFEIDLEGIYEINHVMLKFERAYPKDFEIQVSRDRKSWTTTETVKDWTPSGNDNKANAKYQWNSNISYHGKARYIRINATRLKIKELGLVYLGVCCKRR